MAPLVSIIITTYNRAQLVTKSIESVLNQTFNEYELIVVDDASTDTTKVLLEQKYRSKMIYIGKDRNEGLSAARNTGIKAAQGRYIALLDDDDLWLPEKLELQVSLMQKKPFLGLVYCGYYEINKAGRIMREIEPTKRGKIFDDILFSNCLGPPSASLVKKEVFDNVGYFDENLSSSEDWDMWLRVAPLYEIDFVNQPLVKYRVHDYSMSRNMLTMEKTTFAVINKCLPGISERKSSEEKNNKAYSKNCIKLAWNYYQVGDKRSFIRLLYQALEYYPLSEIVINGDDLPRKERAVFEVFHKFWDRADCSEDSSHRKKAFKLQYVQLAWEYYHKGDMRSFRRCVRKSFRYSFPRFPVRLSIALLKSFLKNNISNKNYNTKKEYLKINEYLESHMIRKLHIGCGDNMLSNWLNTDIKPGDEIMYLDARRELPFEEFTFHYIFSEHFIEHLEYQEGLYFLGECFRILKPGGKIRIATPNIQFLIDLYNREKSELQKRYIVWVTDTFLSSNGVYQDTLVINNFFRDWGHKFIYDLKTLQNVLSEVGFTAIAICKVGESGDENLRDIEHHGKIMPEEFNKLETMVIEAIKEN